MNKNNAVIGLGFGDEGKGLVTDFLCSKSSEKPSEDTLVLRFSGGHQAGHTVVYNGIKHTFSNFGSGTLRGVPTKWLSSCTVDPFGFLNEYKVLKDKGVDPKIVISSKCPITTPYDKYSNQNDHKNLSNGSCGVGFGATIKREESYYSLLMCDLLHSENILKFKLEAIKDYYKSSEPYSNFLETCKRFLDVYEVTSKFDVRRSFKIYEGSQGLLLDKNIGFFPNVTRSNTTLENIDYVDDLDVYLVTRAYQTRHGNGPMTNFDIPFEINNSEETNVSNTYQGSFRTSMLDLDLLKYAFNRLKLDPSSSKVSNYHLVVTCLDHLKEYSLTDNSKVITFKNEDEFVNYISNRLEVNLNRIILRSNLYVSKSSDSSKVIYKGYCK